jgi:hypothetical protein
VLSGTEHLRQEFAAVRAAVGDLNEAVDRADLKLRHEGFSAALDRALDSARSDLMR